jgi:DNA-binding XRE family transcriptional regulator
MAQPVVLVTDRGAFEDAWSRALAKVQLASRANRPAAFASLVQPDCAIVIDAGASAFDEDELLAAVGLACGLRATAVVALPDGHALSGIEDVLDDLCPGLVTRSNADVDRVAALLARRADPDRCRRFEYVTVSPRPNELLAILADGATALLSRPVGEGDDGSEIASIELGADAETATLRLTNGREITVHASQVGGSITARPRTSHAGVDGRGLPIDGARLGARLRELRVAAGLTQAELARRTGIHRPNIARVEAGRHTPSLDTLTRLASAIGVPATRVLAE